MKRSETIILGIVLLSFVVSVYSYPHLPEQVATHWNASGEVDSYMPKSWGVFILPFALLVLSLVFIFIPRASSLKESIGKFSMVYYEFVGLVIGLMFYLHVLNLLWNAGFKIDLFQFVAPAFGGLLYVAGTIMQHAKRNWAIGIRTPWTLKSDEVWKKTHKASGTLFKIAGFIAALGIIFPRYTVFLIIVPLFVVAAYTVVYSRREYQKLRE